MFSLNHCSRRGGHRALTTTTIGRLRTLLSHDEMETPFKIPHLQMELKLLTEAADEKILSEIANSTPDPKAAAVAIEVEMAAL